MNRTLLSVSLVSLAALWACNPSGPQPFDEARSDEERNLNPAVEAGEVEALVDGNSAFAFDLYQELRATEDGNIFFSPFSTSIALAMTYGGARGNTEAEMADALHFTLPQAQLHPAFDYLDLALENRNDDAVDQEHPFALHIANSLWGQTGYPFLTDFLDLLAINYGAGMSLLDFGSDPEACRLVINDWVEEETEGLIEDLIPEGAITDLTRLVLTNAIYFNATWNSPFEVENTADGTFWVSDGAPVTVPMMYQGALFPYAEGAGWQAVELPYDGDVLSMVVILPDDLETFEDTLDDAVVGGIVDQLSWEMVQLTMPKFSFDSSFELSDPLKEMGMVDAFTLGVADFTGIEDTYHELYISKVIHKAHIGVDEKGTEAAAATAVIMEGYGVPDENPLTLDHPFFFLIRDIPSDTILFMGRVVDPS